jgi:hypothetical protein
MSITSQNLKSLMYGSSQALIFQQVIGGWDVILK